MIPFDVCGNEENKRLTSCYKSGKIRVTKCFEPKSVLKTDSNISLVEGDGFYAIRENCNTIMITMNKGDAMKFFDFLVNLRRSRRPEPE